MEDAQLQTIWQQRQFQNRFAHLSEPVGLLMKHNLGKKVHQLADLAKIWDEIIPLELAKHTAVDKFSRGVLTVIVDSSPHRFQLQTLINGGLKKMVQEKFGGAINRIKLVPGQFYSVDINGTQRYEF